MLMKMLVLVAVVIAALAVMVWNKSVRKRNDVIRSLSGIDVQIRRRGDLIPNLESTVKGYAQHESRVLSSIADIRSAMDDDDIEKRMEGSENLRRLVNVVSERYPELRASDNFLSLQEEIANTEDMIQAARRLYNANVNTYNSFIQTFPNNVFTSVMGFKPFESFTSESRKGQFND